MHLGLDIYSKYTQTQAFCSEICNNFRNTYFEEHLSTTAPEWYYNGGKFLRNTSTICKDCFLGALESDKKKKIFFYHWYENFIPFGWGWFWVVVSGFRSLWVVLDGFGWFWVVACFIKKKYP